MTKGHHFLALHADATGEDSITVEVVPSQGMGEITLDSDGIAVVQFADDKSQKLYIRGYKGDAVQTKILDISGMTFEAAGA